MVGAVCPVGKPPACPPKLPVPLGAVVAVAVLMVANETPAHGYLANGNLRIVQKDASGKQLFAKTYSGAEIQQTMGFGLIGGGQTRRVVVPVELPSADGTVEASFSLDN